MGITSLDPSVLKSLEYSINNPVKPVILNTYFRDYKNFGWRVSKSPRSFVHFWAIFPFPEQVTQAVIKVTVGCAYKGWWWAGISTYQCNPKTLEKTFYKNYDVEYTDWVLGGVTKAKPQDPLLELDLKTLKCNNIGRIVIQSENKRIARIEMHYSGGKPVIYGGRPAVPALPEQWTLSPGYAIDQVDVSYREMPEGGTAISGLRFETTKQNVATGQRLRGLPSGWLGAKTSFVKPLRSDREWEVIALVARSSNVVHDVALAIRKAYMLEQKSDCF